MPICTSDIIWLHADELWPHYKQQQSYNPLAQSDSLLIIKSLIKAVDSVLDRSQNNRQWFAREKKNQETWDKWSNAAISMTHRAEQQDLWCILALCTWSRRLNNASCRQLQHSWRSLLCHWDTIQAPNSHW